MGVDLASIRSRLSGLRESLTSTTRSLKGRWGAGAHAAGGGHHRCARLLPGAAGWERSICTWLLLSLVTCQREGGRGVSA